MKNANLFAMKLSLFLFLALVLWNFPLQAAQELVVADFERWPNNLNGEMGVYGGGEPDWEKPVHSWFYSPETPGYTLKNVKSGVKSFRLVNTMEPNSAIWATFAIDLGPTLDVNVEPKKVQSLDVSGYSHLAFWVRGGRGGEHFRVVFRDARAKNYQQEVLFTPLPKGASTEWTYIQVSLAKLKPQLDFKHLDMVGFHFGQNIGNAKGATLFIDDVKFKKE